MSKIGRPVREWEVEEPEIEPERQRDPEPEPEREPVPVPVPQREREKETACTQKEISHLENVQEDFLLCSFFGYSSSFCLVLQCGQAS